MVRTGSEWTEGVGYVRLGGSRKVMERPCSSAWWRREMAKGQWWRKIIKSRHCDGGNAIPEDSGVRAVVEEANLIFS